MDRYITQVTEADGTLWDGPIIYAATHDDAMLAAPAGAVVLGKLIEEIEE
jgi:hypothetical protein